LEAKGYRLDLKIINALELGVPQDRERLIMIGINSNYIARCLGRGISAGERNWFPWPVNNKYKDAKTKYSWPGMCREWRFSRKAFKAFL